MLFLVLLLIVAFSLFIVIWLKKYFFQKLRYGYASVTKRFFAFVVDLAIVNVLGLGCIIGYFVSTSDFKALFTHYVRTIYQRDYFNYMGMDRFWYDVQYLQIWFIAVVCLISIFFEASRLKGSLGKKAVGLTVTNRNGEQLTYSKALVRNLVKYGVVLASPILFFIAQMSKKRSWIHDWVVKSEVRDTSKL
jgi:uncharacterized RDD family membrane protein YckC